MSNNWQPHFAVQDYEKTKESILYPGYCAVKGLTVRYRMFDGGWSHQVVRECVLRPPAIAVLLYDPKADSIVLIEQIRIGALEAIEAENTKFPSVASFKSPWILEVVAGVVDVGETLESTAIREVKEEAGLTVQKLFPICHYLVSPGISAEMIHVFCGVVEAPLKSSLQGLREDGEDIKVHILKSSEALDLLKRGEILSSPTVIALQWFALNRQHPEFFQSTQKQG